MDNDGVGDARFFARSGPYSLAEVTLAAGGTAAASDLIFEGVAPLQSARVQQVSFLHDRCYAGVLDTTQAGAVLIPADLAVKLRSLATSPSDVARRWALRPA